MPAKGIDVTGQLFANSPFAGFSPQRSLVQIGRLISSLFCPYSIGQRMNQQPQTNSAYPDYRKHQVPKLDAFYPLVNSIDLLEQILPAGVQFVQLRIKGLIDQALLDAVATAHQLCTQANCVLVINDFWREAIETGCQFVHLGQEDLDTADLPALRAAGVQVGISTHDQAELDRALAAQANYIALGPIYPTASKSLSWAAQGLEKIASWKRQIGNRPLVAIGGLTLERATAVLAAGADSLAVIGDVSNHEQPDERCRQWLSVTRKGESPTSKNS